MVPIEQALMKLMMTPKLLSMKKLLMKLQMILTSNDGKALSDTAKLTTVRPPEVNNISKRALKYSTVNPSNQAIMKVEECLEYLQTNIRSVTSKNFHKTE